LLIFQNNLYGRWSHQKDSLLFQLFQEEAYARDRQKHIMRLKSTMIMRYSRFKKSGKPFRNS
jgi:hypothetical protein